MRVKQAQGLIQQLVNHIAVYEQIEDEVFGQPVSVSNLVSKAKGLIPEVVDRQNSVIKDLLESYNIFKKHTKSPFTFKDADMYQLRVDIEPEADWIKETVLKLVEMANDESGYHYRWNT